MESATESPFYGILPVKLAINTFCANCTIYNWKEAPENQKLLKCKKCQVVSLKCNLQQYNREIHSWWPTVGSIARRSTGTKCTGSIAGTD